MARRDLSNRDATAHAVSELDYVIKSKDRRAQVSVPTMTAQEAMRDARVATTVSDRSVARVLFISNNTDLLNPVQQSLDGYINISELFDEVHILILREGIPPKNPALRVAENVWLYTAAAKHWWQTPRAGLELIKDQLEFAAGFRADLIVARDPFESAVVAAKLGTQYGRPTQLHILDDFSGTHFGARSVCSYWRRFVPRFTVPKFRSVRTQTEALAATLADDFSVLDLAVLPRYQNYEAVINAKAQIDLVQKYQPFAFFMLYVGDLGHDSSFHTVLDASRYVLQQSRAALIVLGDGKARNEFQKRAQILGIEKQVIFEPKVPQVLPYLKSGHMLIVSDTNTESEELVLQGAAAGIPLVLTHTEQRDDVFVHDESALLSEPDDVQTLADNIYAYFKNEGKRRQATMAARELIREKFHSDPSVYREAYRASIEQALFVDEEPGR